MKELIVNSEPKSSVAEAINKVRTNLRFSSVNQKIKTILITSSMSGEGKSFISANLAAAFANTGENVLIVDCDLRRGRQKKIFGFNNNKVGLSDLLIDEDWLDNIKKYFKKTNVANLTLLPAGSVPPNPSVLLESDKMNSLIKALKRKYDVIIFDTPPVSGLSDSLIMTKFADAVLIVARAKKTNIDLLEETKKSLLNVNANIAGVILNSIALKNNKYYNNYYTDN